MENKLGIRVSLSLSLSLSYACRKKNCRNCCSRWWINIDGSECSNYESIETSIASSTPVDIFVPTTLTGVCYESGDLPISTGFHQITLMVGNCPGSPFTNAASGLYSTSRLIVEEIPRRKYVLLHFVFRSWNILWVSGQSVVIKLF